MKTLILFCYDESQWSQFLGIVEQRTKAGLKTLVVINADSGPSVGAVRDRWAAFARSVKAAGAVVMGYVDLHMPSGRVKSEALVTIDIGIYRAGYLTEQRKPLISLFFFDDAHPTDEQGKIMKGVMKRFPNFTWVNCIANPGEPVSEKSWPWELGFQVCDHEDPLPVNPKSRGPIRIIFAKNGGQVTDTWDEAKGVTCMGFDDLENHHQKKEFQKPLTFADVLAALR